MSKVKDSCYPSKKCIGCTIEDSCALNRKEITMKEYTKNTMVPAVGIRKKRYLLFNCGHLVAVFRDRQQAEEFFTIYLFAEYGEEEEQAERLKRELDIYIKERVYYEF